MDKEQLAKRIDEFNQQYIRNLEHIQFVRKKSNFSKKKTGKIGDILAQRHSQRDCLFWFSLIFVSITTLFVLVLIGLQAYLNFHGYTKELVDNTTLQIIVTGLFVQFVGLVGIITKSIWNDKDYLEAGVIEERKKLYEQETIQKID